MKRINLGISGCMGRMGQQLIRSSKKNKNFKLVALTENRLVNKKFIGIKPEFNSGLTPLNFLFINLFSVSVTNLKFLFFFEDLINCWPILPMQPEIAKLIFFI